MYRSRFTENKTALSQCTKNMTLQFSASRKVKENVLQNHGSRRLWKHDLGQKNSNFTFPGKYKGPITGHENTLYHPL